MPINLIGRPWRSAPGHRLPLARGVAALACVTALSGAAARAQTARFYPLQDFLQDARIQGSWAYGVNSDGTVIVGAALMRSETAPFEHRAALWRLAPDGQPSLPSALAGDENFATAAVGVSDDGDRIVGSAGLYLEYFDGPRYEPRNAFYWWGLNSGSPEFAIVNNVLAFHDLAADGSVAYGQLRLTDWPEPIPTFGFEWHGPGTPFDQLPTPGWGSGAYSCTRDGGVAVGWFGNPDSTYINGAVWTDSGLSGVPGFPADRWHEAHAISGNGRWITGPTDPDAFLWGVSEGIGIVPQLDGTSWSRPAAVSDDGRSIVGECTTDTENGFVDEAFIWHPDQSTRRLSEELAQRGADVAGWTLRSATAMSDDGSVVVGYGVNPTGGVQGFLVRFCRADFDRNGQADFFDYLDFVNAFSGEDPAADFDGNGQLDFFDYLDFATVFSAGC